MAERRIHDYEFRVLIPGDRDEILVQAQDFRAAKAAFQSLVDSRPRSPLYLLHRARIMLKHEPEVGPVAPRTPILDL